MAPRYISCREGLLNAGLMHNFQMVSEPLESVCKIVDVIFFLGRGFTAFIRFLKSPYPPPNVGEHSLQFVVYKHQKGYGKSIVT